MASLVGGVSAALLGLDGSQESRIYLFGQKAELASSLADSTKMLSPTLSRLFGAPEGELMAEAILPEVSSGE